MKGVGGILCIKLRPLASGSWFISAASESAKSRSSSAYSKRPIACGSRKLSSAVLKVVVEVDIKIFNTLSNYIRCS